MKDWKAKRQFSAVAQIVGFGLSKVKMLYLAMRVDVCVVDLDIGASKSDICAVRVVIISERWRIAFFGRLFLN
jgi:hypothetical protein